MNRISLALAALLLCVNPCAAQGVSLTPTDPKRWDFAFNTGWMGGNKSGLAEEWNDWYDTFATSVDVGRYWTPNIKTEATFAYTTDGDVYSQEQLNVPGQQFPIFFTREHTFGLASVRLAAAYQFFQNGWVHPYVMGGAQLGWERHSVETPFPFISGRDPQARFSVPDLEDTLGTRFKANPFVGTGAKFYVTERGFIRTDLSAAFDGRGATNVAWRVGIGVDF